ncbi:MAG: hypothetical protein J6H21_00235 [Firmicutes bacterium]|nr:hypothetical protein [Bacillota bacterium]
MRVMIDTNILISAVLFPKGKASCALIKALAPPYEPDFLEASIEDPRVISVNDFMGL